jgi:stage II sporulation protein P
MDGLKAYQHVDEVIPTKRIWTAKPFLVAYVVAVAFTLGILINRAPLGRQALPATTGNAPEGHTEREPREPPLWQQLFRPSQPTVRWILRMGLPVLAVADGSATRAEQHSMITYWTGQTARQPQSFFQTMLPFLRPGEATADNTTPPPQQGSKPDARPPAPPPATGGQAGQPAMPPSADGQQAVVAGGQPLVGIYHTHDWESYISEFPGLVVSTAADMNKIQSESHTKRTIMGIGKRLALRLKELGVTTVYADYTHRDLGYDYAYRSSRVTAKEILKQQPSVKILMDIHRDTGEHTAIIGGKKYAQIRCIMGLQNPGYAANQRLCESVLRRLEEQYPGIMLPTRLQDDMYNQDLMPGAILVEIGGALNQYSEAERSILALADALAGVIRSGEYLK